MTKQQLSDASQKLLEQTPAAQYPCIYLVYCHTCRTKTEHRINRTGNGRTTSICLDCGEGK